MMSFQFFSLQSGSCDWGVEPPSSQRGYVRLKFLLTTFFKYWRYFISQIAEIRKYFTRCRSFPVTVSFHKIFY